MTTSEFPRTAEEFYARRDDRTSRCCASLDYQSVSCAVQTTEASASTVVGQAMIIAAANLLSRWCRRVRIRLAPVRMLPALGMGSGDLGDIILHQMQDADPFGDFVIDEQDVSTTDVSLCIGGATPPLSAQHAICIDASGWLASLSWRQPLALPRVDDNNVVGAIGAACLGVTQVFKTALGMPSALLLREGVLDLFHLRWSTDLATTPWPQDLDIGRILMVGAGSVGSSAAYCMRLSGLRGSVAVVDQDIVKVENFNRSPIFGRVTAGLSKARAVSDFLSGSPLVATPHEIWWDDFLKLRGRNSFDFDVWLPLANEFNVRSSIQNNVPPLMIHASTTANWGVNHGRHIPGHDDCLADRFPTEITAAALTCSTGTVEVSGTVVDAALPFASLFAGLLITADLVRLQLPGYPQVPNFALFDWYGSLDVVQAWDRKPRDGCICRDQGRTFHERFNGNTRHISLFQF